MTDYQDQSETRTTGANNRQRFRAAGVRARAVYDSAPSFLQSLMWVLFISLLCVLAAVAYINIQPYAVLANQLLGPVSIGTSTLESLPLIGKLAPALKTLIFWGLVGGSFYFAYREGGWKAVGIVGAFALIAATGGIQVGVGTLIWAVVQTLQTLWIVINLDKFAIKGALKQAQAIGDEVGQVSDRTDRRVAAKLKRVPYFFVRWAVLLALGAYTFDLIVGWALYPPAKSPQAFIDALSIGMWSAINTPMLYKLLVMLFAFELVLLLTLVVWQWIQSHRAGKGE